VAAFFTGKKLLYVDGKCIPNPPWHTLCALNSKGKSMEWAVVMESRYDFSHKDWGTLACMVSESQQMRNICQFAAAGWQGLATCCLAGMCACTRVHIYDNELCTRLQNYTIRASRLGWFFIYRIIHSIMVIWSLYHGHPTSTDAFSSFIMNS